MGIIATPSDWLLTAWFCHLSFWGKPVTRSSGGPLLSCLDIADVWWAGGSGESSLPVCQALALLGAALVPAAGPASPHTHASPGVSTQLCGPRSKEMDEDVTCLHP